MTLVEIVTTLAATCTTISYAPQVIHSWRTKETEDLSMIMLIIFVVGMILWTITGFLMFNLPMMIANTLSSLLCFSLIILKLKYGKK